MDNRLLASTRITFAFIFSLLFYSSCYALPFTIEPKAGTQLPTVVSAGSTATAYYTVTNNTASQRDGNYVKYLPPNVSQVTSSGTYNDTCATTFSLAKKGDADSSCTLQLSVSGPVSSADPDPHHHLFVCFPGGLTCTGTTNQLNVTQGGAAQLAYIVNFSSNSVSLCTIDAAGFLTQCNNTGDGFNSPVGITLNAAHTIAYVAKCR